MNRSYSYCLMMVCLIAILSACALTSLIEPPEILPPPDALLRKSADWVVSEYPDPPPFNWGEMVMMVGMVRAGQVTGNDRYIEFVKRWADHWRQEGIGPILEKRGYCGHWGAAYPVLMLYEETDDRAYLEVARQVVDFIVEKATCTKEGGFDHWRDNRQLWLDTLYMSCPLLVNYGRLTSQGRFIDEAARQLHVSQSRLQDKKTGLFYHMYDEPKDERTSELWGRGNGWTAMSYVEVLKRLDPQSNDCKQLAAEFQRQVDGLLATQDPKTGLWRTVLDRPDSYLETSVSAMILYSLVEAKRLGVVKRVRWKTIRSAWAGLATKIDESGKVFDVSVGTGPSDFAGYMKVQKGTQTWGTGAFLLAASVLAER